MNVRVELVVYGARRSLDLSLRLVRLDRDLVEVRDPLEQGAADQLHQLVDAEQEMLTRDRKVQGELIPELLGLADDGLVHPQMTGAHLEARHDVEQLRDGECLEVRQR